MDNSLKTKNESQNMFSDSLSLIIVQIVTISVGIVQAMILARMLTKNLYGTYAQSIFVYSFFTPLFSLGLGGAINYFFNKTADIETKRKYINTIFFMSFISGLVGGFLLLFTRSFIVQYFSNAELMPLLVYVVFRPFISNFIALYQPLYISSGYARVIALRNLIISLSQICIITIISYYTKNLVLLTLLLLALDVIQLLIFSLFFRRKKFPISIIDIKFSYIKPILKFSLPMLMSILLGTISINLDKLLIGNLMTTEDFALYSMMAKELPFYFVVGSITAVITPNIIKYIHQKDMDSFKSLWADYLEIGYTITWTLIFGIIGIAPIVIELLYSVKYLVPVGVNVFRVYLLVAAFRFTYFGLIASALGKTKIILMYTLIAISINIILNYPFYYFFGMIGPSLSTLLSMLVSAILYFAKSMQLVSIKLNQILRFKNFIRLLIALSVSGIVQKFLIENIGFLIKNSLLQFTFSYALFIFIVFLIERKQILLLYHNFKSYT